MLKQDGDFLLLETGDSLLLDVEIVVLVRGGFSMM